VLSVDVFCACCAHAAQFAEEDFVVGTAEPPGAAGNDGKRTAHTQMVSVRGA
jgi:hypothetical protein